MTGLLTASGTPVPSADILHARLAGINAGAISGGGAYRSGERNEQATAGWTPYSPSADGAVLPAKDVTLARVRDLIRNDSTAGAALDKLVDLLIGPGLRLSAKPDAAALGISPEAARALGKRMEAEWRLFGCQDDPGQWCDAQRRQSIHGLFRLFCRTWLTANEATAVLTWRDDPRSRYSTCIMAIDPDRLSNPLGAIDTMERRGGVEMDAFGAPVAYHVRNAHAGDWWAYGRQWSWTRVPRSTSWGRPIFMHAFEPEREGQTRGISPFASLVVSLKMLGKFEDSELASAALNALFAAFVESDLPPDDIADRMTAAAALNGGASRSNWTDQIVDFYSKNPAKLGGVRIPVMLPGTKITMNSSPRQTAAFNHFETAFLRKVASRLGLSYEQLAMDWSMTNYSSARAALNEVWRTVRRMFSIFGDLIANPIRYAHTEEAIEKGYIQLPPGAPSFQSMPGAYLRGRWIGPPRGYVDPVKEADAASMRMAAQISTLEAECAEQGLDYEEVLDQIAFENAERTARGLPDPAALAALKASGGRDPAHNADPTQNADQGQEDKRP